MVQYKHDASNITRKEKTSHSLVRTSQLNCCLCVKPVKTMHYDSTQVLREFQALSSSKEGTIDLPVYLKSREPTMDKLSDDSAIETSGKENGNIDSKKITMRTILDELRNLYSFINVDQQLYVYIEDEGYWKLILPNDNNRELRWLIPEQFINHVNKNTLYELYEWLLRYSTRQPLEIFRRGRHCLNFSDVAFDWKEKKIKKSRKKMFFRYSLKISYKQSKKSSGMLKKFLDETFEGDSKTIREFQKFFALALSDIRNLKLAFFIVGPSNTSKSVILGLLRELAGASNCAALSFSKMNNDFAIAQLLGTRLNLSGESSGTSSIRLDTFKALTGNDCSSACFKNKDYFSFQNMSLLVFATNTLPEIKEIGEAESFLSRVVIFPLKHVVPREKWSNNIVNKLLHEDTAGFVSFIIEGMQKLAKDDYIFHPTDNMEECKRNYYGLYDSFSLFAKKYIEADHKSRLPSAEITEAYRAFCDEHAYVELKQNQWSSILEKMFFCTRCFTSRTVNGKDSQVRGYAGIRFTKKVEKLFKTTTDEGFHDNIVNAISEIFEPSQK